MIRHARTRSAAEAGWLRGVLERRPARLASVALANKTARIAWAVLARGGTYRKPDAAAAASPGRAAAGAGQRGCGGDMA